MVLLRASQYVDASGSIVRSAEAVARAVVEHLAGGDEVTVSLAGLKGLPSSYFNPILRAVREALGLTPLQRRLRFEFDSPAQELVYERSLRAVQTEAA